MAGSPSFNIRKDSGWAWMIVLGCFIMNALVVGGAAKSFGILYVELVDKYQTSSSATLSVVAISQSLCMLLGPVANMLAMRFTSRRVVMFGGLTMCCGFILTMFPPSIVYLYFSYGALVGVGSAMAYAPSIVTVGQYFERRRALANGLSVAGSGVGNFIVPPFIRLAVDKYGFQGALLILSAVMLNVCLAGALLRPPGSRLNPPPRGRSPGEEENNGKSGGRKGTVLTGLTKTPGHDGTSTADDTTDDPTSQLQSAVLSPDAVVANKPTGETNQPTTGSSRCNTEPANPTSATSKNCNSCKSLLDWSLLTNPVFLVYGFAAMFVFTGYPPLYIMLPDHARMIGISKTDAAYLVSILGLSDVVGRICFGFVADFNLVPKRYIFIGCMTIAGSLMCGLSRVEGFVGLAVLLAATGLFAGAFFTFLMVVLAEKLGVQRLHSAFGLAAMFMGVSFFYSAPITGSLKDITGTWHASYLFSGLSMLCGAAVLLLDPLAVRYEQRRRQQKLTSHVTLV